MISDEELEMLATKFHSNHDGVKDYYGVFNTYVLNYVGEKNRIIKNRGM